MDAEQKELILEKAKIWFRVNIAESHMRNTRRLVSSKEFQINPFTAVYLASFLKGVADADGIARALIYPRVFGTSIATTFGNHVQRFTSDVLDGFASTTSGIDIEFEDHVDGLRKYCQIKSGPNTINNDDVATISGHFGTIRRLARTNNLSLDMSQLVVGVVYGEASQLNGNYRLLERDYHYNVIIGNDFWYRLTGDQDFYEDLLGAITEVAVEANFQEELEGIIAELANDPIIAAMAVTDDVGSVEA
ncbi:restriction endonuclease [Ochrobactrum sp. GRS2]|nr:restriction endonuclease [Ochrobactrum sp. GRS2]